MTVSTSRYPNNILARFQEPGSAKQLGLLRIIFGAYILFLYSSPMFLFLAELQPRPWGNTWSLFPDSMIEAIGANAVLLFWTAVGSTLLMTVGLFTRASTVVATVCYILLFGFFYRVTKSHVEWPYWNFIFVVFCFAPAGDRWSLDALRKTARPTADGGYRWPVETAIFWIALTYVFAGLAKLFPLRSGIGWMAGDMLHHIVTGYYFDSPVHWLSGAPLFDYSLGWPFAVCSILAVLIELAAALMLVQRRWNAAIMLAIIGMHFGIYVFTGVNAFIYSGSMCLCFFIPPEWFDDFAAAHIEGTCESGEPEPRARPAASL